MDRFKIPGTHATLTYSHTANGQLEQLCLDNTPYLQCENGRYRFEGDWFAFVEKKVGRQLFRMVQTPRESWLEHFTWGKDGLLANVDGTAIDRNKHGYVTTCTKAGEVWRYEYQDHLLTRIHSPLGIRTLAYDSHNRPITATTETGSRDFSYNTEDVRQDSPNLPTNWHTDALGRLWTITDSNGTITTTYLWYGFACLARIDGPPGEPIAAIFSLDPTGTPIRVTTPAGSQSITRDAFGENVSHKQGVPGLFGGGNNKGFTHYRSRVLDATLGSFTAPDPFHGRYNDPRRDSGYSGPLPVEMPPAGGYCVCQHDPISRLDPTGESSADVGTFFTTLSSLTWSFQNNLVGINTLGFLNILASLLTFQGRVIERIGDVESMKAPYTGAWGVRAHPSGLEALGINRGRAWTIQHLIWARSDKFEELEKARVFVADDTFEPELLGTVLLVQPAHGKKKNDPAFNFILSGTRRDTFIPSSGSSSNDVPLTQSYGYAQGWTRSGGTGTPVFPGCRTPYFPNGGIHFPYQRYVPSPVKATIAELVPTGEIFQGRMRTRFTITAEDFENVPQSGTSICVGNDQYLEFLTVRGDFLENGKRILVAEEVPNTIAHFEGDLTEVSFAENLETLPQGSNIDRLNTSTPLAITFDVGQFVGLKASDQDQVQGAKILRIEADVSLDRLPPGSNSPSLLRVLSPTSLLLRGECTVLNGTNFTIENGEPTPNIGGFIVLATESQSFSYFIADQPTLNNFEVEGQMDQALINAQLVQWFTIEAEARLGTWNGNQALDITIQSQQTGLVPDNGPLIFRDEIGGFLGVRNITNKSRDELILSRNLPSGTGPFELRTAKKSHVLAGSIHTQDHTVLSWFPATGAPESLLETKAMQLIPTVGSVISTGLQNDSISQGVVIFSGHNWAGTQLLIADYSMDFILGFNETNAPMPGQVVVLKETTSNLNQLVIVKTLTKNVSFAFEPDFSTVSPIPREGWELFPIVEQGMYFKANRIGNKQVVLQPEAYRMNGNFFFDRSNGSTQTDTVWMPRFQTGDMVRAVWDSGSGPTITLYKITKQTGASLELQGPQNLPANMPDIAFCKMVPSSPNNGTLKAGFSGTREVRFSGNNPPVVSYQFSVSHPNGIPLGAYALVNGTNSWPVTVVLQNHLLIAFYDPPILAGKTCDLIIPATEDASLHSASHRIVKDEWFFTQSHLLPSENVVLVKPYANPDQESQVSGRLSPGTVGIPDDKSKTYELDRRQSLESHELQHTLQSAMKGPTLLSMIPLFLFDIIAKAEVEGLETAHYSSFVNGKLSSKGPARFLHILNPQDIEFATDRRVQLVQNTAFKTVILGTQDNGLYRVSNIDDFSDGAVKLRLQRNQLTEDLATTYSWLELFSIAGLENALVGPTFNFLPWLVAQIVHACKGDPKGRFLQPDLFPATVPDPNNPFVVEVAEKDGDTHSFHIHDVVELVVDKKSETRQVVAVAGNLVSLDKVAIYEGPNHALQIGKLHESHPMKEVSDAVSNIFGTTDLRWFFDPLGQLFYEVDENDQGGLDWTLTALRAFYSTSSWSGVGFFGLFWIDIVWTTVFGEAYHSFAEQGASEMSGDLYSPVGRKQGDLKYVGDLVTYHYYHDLRNGTENTEPVIRLGNHKIQMADEGANGNYRINAIHYKIGDSVTVNWEDTNNDEHEAMFEITAIEKIFNPTPSISLSLRHLPALDMLGAEVPGGLSNYSVTSNHLLRFNRSELINQNLGETAGLPTFDFLRIMPFRDPPGSPGNDPANDPSEPNLAAGSPAPSSQALPHELYFKSRDTPLNPEATGPLSYRPSALGMVPATAESERSRGMYVAFSQPSGNPHRLTVRNNFSLSPHEGRDAMMVCGTSRQTFIYDEQVQDVEVSSGFGQITGSLGLVYCQSVQFSVSPNENRHYQATVLNPEQSSILRTNGSMSLLAQAQTGTAYVEISRFYDGQTPATHLNQAFHVPVRAINVTVSDTLVFRTLPNFQAPEVSRDALPGDTFFLAIPATISDPSLANSETFTYNTQPPNGHQDPLLTKTPLPKVIHSGAELAYLGSGRLYSVNFPANQPPEESVTIEWSIGVEAGQEFAPQTLTANLKATIVLQPHFILITANPNNFSMPASPGNTLNLTSNSPTIAFDPTVIITTADSTIANPQSRFDLAVIDNGQTLAIQTNNNTLPGMYQVLVSNRDNQNQKAIRTIEVL